MLFRHPWLVLLDACALEMINAAAKVDWAWAWGKQPPESRERCDWSSVVT